MEYKNNLARGVYRQDDRQLTHDEIQNATSSSIADKLNLKDSDAIKKNLIQTALIIVLSVIVFVINLFLRKYIVDIQNTYNTSSLLILSVLIGIILWCAGNILIAPAILSRRCKESGVAKCIGYEDKQFQLSKYSGIVQTAAIFEHTYDSETYTVYNGRYVKNDQQLPALGQIVPVRFNKKNPNICVINNETPTQWKKIILIAVCLVMLIPFALSPTINSNKMILDETTLKEDFPDTDYIVYERTIMEVIGNTYYFNHAGGVHNYATTDMLSGCESGDKIYWIQSSDGYYVLYPKARYEYRGNKTYDKNAMVSEGHFVLTPDYLKEQLQASSVTVYDGTISAIGTNYIDLRVSQTSEFHIEYNTLNATAMGLSVGEKVYYVTWDYQGIIYSQRYNTYAGPLQ